MSVMYQGTTAINTFELPFPTQTVDKFKIMYRQSGNIVLVKRSGDEGVTVDGNVITVIFTQEETFYFDEKRDLEIQLRLKTLGGEVATSEPMITTVAECFDREVL